MATSTRRIGVLGTICLVALVGVGVVGFIHVTAGTQPARRCVGGAAGAAGAAAPTGANAVGAIARYATTASPPAYLTSAVSSVPGDGWIRRSETLYEHAADDDRLLQVDVVAAGDQFQVAGLWVCSPLPGS